MDSFIPLQENVPGHYESFDVITRLYCLQLLNFDLEEFVYYPPHLIFAEDDELTSPDWRTQELKRMIEDPEPAHPLLSEFLFLTSDNPAESCCALPHPPVFYDQEALRAALSHVKEYRQRGYCPLHRHPVLVDFVETLSTLLGRILDECVQHLDPKRANLSADSPVIVPGDPPRTLLDELYEHDIVEKHDAVTNGMVKFHEDDDEIPRVAFRKCKGCRFRHCVEVGDTILPVAQISGSETLLPFMLDLMQLHEMQRIRAYQQTHIGHFWASIEAMTSIITSAKEYQCLRETMPPDLLGEKVYDTATLGEDLLQRFRFCREQWGMKDLPDMGINLV